MKPVRDAIHHLPSDELLALLLSPSPLSKARTLASALLHSTNNNLAALSRTTPRELAQTPGLDAARAARVAAAFELGRRAVSAATARRTALGRPEDIFDIVAPRLAGLAQEVFIVIGLDIRNGLVDVIEVARGTAIGVEVHPREVFRPLIRMAAAGGVLVHNHPSGDPTPSAEDIELTHRMREIGRLLGIPIIDHVIVGNTAYRSIAEWVGFEDTPALGAA